MATENVVVGGGGGGGGGVSSNRNAASSSRSNTTADSYIGSLISLTSKSEIRYEGVLYDINAEESSIGLSNVRSFGTEGRKKDGAQIPPSDKVYEYILFRGSDIKDLQVKSSSPIQPTPPINNDPAIIQSHFPHSVPLSTSFPFTASESLSDIGSLNPPMGLPGSNFQGGLPLYQPAAGLGTWGASLAPSSASGSGLAMPLYWQGYYGPPNGISPHLPQQSLLRSSPGLSVPASLHQPMQYPNFNTPLPSGTSMHPNANLSASYLPSSTLPVSNLPVSTLPLSNLVASTLPITNLPFSTLSEIPSPLIPLSISSHTLTPVSSSVTSTLPLFPSATKPSETTPSFMPNKTPSSVLPAASLTLTSPEISVTVSPISSKPGAIHSSTIAHQHTTQSATVSSNSTLVDVSTPAMATPSQLFLSGPATVSSSQPLHAAHKDVEVVRLSSSTSPEASVPVAVESQPPILPSPVPSRPSCRPNGANFHYRHGYHGRERGRGRGTGSSRPVTTFTEDFDFMAMNEKFKKDEVWGHLGKNNRSPSKGKDDGDFSGEDDSQHVDDKPVYNKDDFFDTFSCNAHDHESQNGRTKFSEQLKIDTETFGDLSRYRGRSGHWPPRGGRWPPRGGRWPPRGGRWPPRGGRWPPRGGRWPTRGGGSHGYYDGRD